MSKKAILLVFLIFIPGILYADIWDNSASSFYASFYIVLVLPVLVWIANWIILVQSLRGKRINGGTFWTIVLANFLLALFSLLPVYHDLSNYKEDGYSLFVFIVLILLPLAISIWSIYLRRRHSYSNDQTT